MNDRLYPAERHWAHSRIELGRIIGTVCDAFHLSLFLQMISMRNKLGST
jgi:hypothetical protein